jgi:TRAP-type C4-dicarboxylate transport system substrate-binding protein
MRLTLLLLVAIAAVPRAVVAADAAGTDREYKLSTALSPAYALGRAAARWAELVGEKSAGRLRIKLHPGATLAQRDPAREFAALRGGEAELAVGSSLAWADAVPALNLVGLPWIAPTDIRLAAFAREPLAGVLRDALAAAGVEPLAFAPLGHRALVLARNGLARPDELTGLRLRIPSSMLLADLYGSMGALPRTLGFADAQAAFKAGTLDGQDGAPAAFVAARLDALGMRQVVDWKAVGELAVFAVNRRVWQGWPAADQEVVRAAAVQAAEVLAVLARDENDRALAELRRQGYALTRLTPEGRTAFTAAAKSAYDKAEAAIGPAVVRSAEAVLATGAP